ncbi:MAG: cupin domain-containing protein [Candidatus Competibacterales bacterium]
MNDAPPSIGARIRELRTARAMTIADLARSIGRSVGYVSQVERNLSPVSVAVLGAISEALGVKITWFFQGDPTPEEERGRIVRAAHRRSLTFGDSGMHEAILSPQLVGELGMTLCTLSPGATSGEEPLYRDAEEVGLLLEGRLRLWSDDRDYLLDPGDSFCIPRPARHRWYNPGPATTVVVWAIAPPVY